MAKGNVVLLLRPDPFFVEHMKKALSKAGYVPYVMEYVTELNQFEVAKVRGVVISAIEDKTMSLLGGSKTTPSDVLMKVRERLPEAPVVFACLQDVKDLIVSVGATLKSIDSENTLLPLSTKSLEDPRLGTNKGFLFVQRDDLSKPAQQKMIDALLKKQFGH